MEKTAEGFVATGGFGERMSRARIEARDAEQAAGTGEDHGPDCPKCGGPMRRTLAKKGRNAGHPFWSCRKWPACDGTRAG